MNLRNAENNFRKTKPTICEKVKLRNAQGKFLLIVCVENHFRSKQKIQFSFILSSEFLIWQNAHVMSRQISL